MCGSFAPGKKVSFPVAWHGAVLSLGGSLADGDHIEYVSLSILGLAAFGVAHLAPGTQTASIAVAISAASYSVRCLSPHSLQV